MDVIVVRRPRWHYAIPLLGSIAIVAGSMWALKHRPSWMAWVLIFMFLMCVSAYAQLWFQSRVQLILDRDGIFDPTWNIGTVRWTDVKEVFVRNDRGEEIVCFSFWNRPQFQSRLGTFARRCSEAMHAKGYGDFTVNTTRLGLRSNDVVEFATKRIAETR